jgi:mannose-1-phosphate guanylyltransferase
MSQLVAPENILVVTSQQYGNLVKEHLPQIPEENILLEPYRRNTAPCIAYAASKIYYKDKNATMVITPSDHFISNENLYLQTISAALDYASTHDDLYTIGIEPNRPETAYGYIQKEMNDMKEINGHIAYNVKTFTEKPSYDMAKVLVDSGEFLWNSGIFIWNVKFNLCCKFWEFFV